MIPSMFRRTPKPKKPASPFHIMTTKGDQVGCTCLEMESVPFTYENFTQARQEHDLHVKAVNPR